MVDYGTICSSCKGVKTIPTSDIDNTPMECPSCEGSGIEIRGQVDLSDIIAKLDKLDTRMDKLETLIEALE